MGEKKTKKKKKEKKSIESGTGKSSLRGGAPKGLPVLRGGTECWPAAGARTGLGVDRASPAREPWDSGQATSPRGLSCPLLNGRSAMYV